MCQSNGCGPLPQAHARCGGCGDSCPVAVGPTQQQASSYPTPRTRTAAIGLMRSKPDRPEAHTRQGRSAPPGAGAVGAAGAVRSSHHCRRLPSGRLLQPLLLGRQEGAGNVRNFRFLGLEGPGVAGGREVVCGGSERSRGATSLRLPQATAGAAFPMTSMWAGPFGRRLEAAHFLNTSDTTDHTHARADARANTHTHTHTQNTHTHKTHTHKTHTHKTHTQTRTHTCTRTCTHTHVHAHTHKRARARAGARMHICNTYR
jgi:hypothetical protein